MSIKTDDKLDEDYWQLEKDSNACITHILMTLGQMKLEYSQHTKAVRELTSNVNYVLQAYRQGRIDYETGSKIFKLFALGFSDGVRAVDTARRYRPERNAERASIQQGGYQRNMTVNNQSFNVRFNARCASAECLMRGANFDLTDDAFQEYVEAAAKDKKDDIMTTISIAAIAFPAAKALDFVANANTAINIVSETFNGKGNTVASYVIGKGLGYKLKQIGIQKGVYDRADGAAAFITGNFLNENTK